jgi:glutamine amidotransferase
MKVAIVRYNAGNVRSVKNALDRLGVESFLTDDSTVLQTADKIIFPGVGEASSAMNHLRELKLDKVITSSKQPVLAICLGMQLLCESSEENDTACLRILPYKVLRFRDGGNKIPHMGWNNISNLNSSLFDGVVEESRFYFVHTYYVEIGEHTIADTNYGLGYSSAIAHKNFYGVQFHPEKSGPVGARVIENFLKI